MIRPQYQFLNVFRALAAFWVVVAHCQIWGGWFGSAKVPDAKLAVDLFMLISGFLMVATTQRADLSSSRERNQFWLRRFFRIAPAYYFALLVTILAAPLLLPGKTALQALNPAFWHGTYDQTAIRYTLDNVVMHVTFLFGLFPQYADSTGMPDWSLGLEMQFYAAFPFLTLALVRYGKTLFPLVAGVVVFYAGDMMRHDWGTEPSLLAFKLQYFLAGMLLWHALHSQGAQRMALVAVGCVLCALEARHGRAQLVMPMLLLVMFALGSLEFAGQSPKAWARVAGSRVVAFASDTSYSVYLLHGVFIGLFGALLPIADPILRTCLMAALVIPAAYASAWLVFRTIEQPGIALGRRLSWSGRAQRVA